MAERLTWLVLVLVLVALTVLLYDICAGGLDEFLTTYGDHT